MISRYWPLLAAAISGLLLALCFPPFERNGFIWIWQAPLLAALWLGKSRKRAKGKSKKPWKRGFGLGYLCGFVFFSINLVWLFELRFVAGLWAGIGAVVGLAGYLGLYFAVFGAFANTVGKWAPPAADQEEKKKTQANQGPGLFGGSAGLFDQSIAVLRMAFLNGAAWAGLEWLRGWLFTGFGWNGLGVALHDQLMLIQFADTIGVTGYGFVLMFVGCVAFATVCRFVQEARDRKRLKPHLDFAVAVALVIGLFLYGFGKVVAEPEDTLDIRARVIQLNISQEEKWTADSESMRKIARDYAEMSHLFHDIDESDLILWPETAIPTYFSSGIAQEYFNEYVLMDRNFYLLTGIEEFAALTDEAIYNTIVLMREDTSSFQMYKKMHLVPFGETIPLRDSFPIFRWMLGHIIAKDFSAGDSYDQLELEKGEVTAGIIPLICFEDTVGRHARRFIRGGRPEFLVNVTNDGWFRESSASRQHFYNSIFRCIELRRPMVRAANTGISGFVDERGSLYDRKGEEMFQQIVQDEDSGNTFIRGSIPATMRLDKQPPITIYARIGDAFSITLGCLAMLFALFYRKKRSL